MVFSWLFYDSPAAREAWPRYLDQLRSLGISEERLRAQVRCRFIPATFGRRSIDWRIAIFGDQIALCSYDPDAASASAAGQTFTLDAPGELMSAFGALFDACPPAEGAAAPTAPPELARLRAAHAALKMAFLRSFKEGLPTDIMLHRLEEASESSRVLLDQTRLLIWISVLTLVAVVATIVLTQVKLP